MSDQVTPEVNTAADLAKLRDEGRPLNSQALKELTARVKALEEMAKLEDRLRDLENRKRPRPSEFEEDQPKLYKPDRPRNPSSAGHYLVL